MTSPGTTEHSGRAAQEPGGSHDRDHDHHDHRGGLVGVIRSIFAPHSHDSADSVDSALESSAKGIRAVKISLVALMITAAAQVAVVFVTGSVALLADTIHNFSDALTAVPLWIAFVLGRRAANRRYTYGYRRAEDLAGLFIVGMIAFSAALAGWESIRRLMDPQPISNLGLVMAAGVLGFIGNEFVAMYRIRVGKEIGSAALVADGYHARTDGFTSLAVVVGAIGVLLGFPQADPLIGLLITVAILWILKGAARQVFGRLMDAVDPALVDDIEHRAAAIEGVEWVDGVRVRWIGHRLEASLHATVDCEVSVADGHRIAETVRHELLHTVKGLDEVLVHVDPCGHDGQDPHTVAAHHGAGVRVEPTHAHSSIVELSGIFERKQQALEVLGHQMAFSAASTRQHVTAETLRSVIPNSDDLDDRELGLALHRQFDLALALTNGLASHSGAVLGEAYRREGPYVVKRLAP